MRQRFELQPGLQLIPLEKTVLPLSSRDELPPILAGLQWIFIHCELNEQIFALLEKKILGGKKATGRTGMDLWQILVLGKISRTADERPSPLKRGLVGAETCESWTNMQLVSAQIFSE